MSKVILCKLTDQNLRTYGGFQWELNVPPPRLSGVGGLCSSNFYHCYEHPLLAVLLNPTHAKIENPRGFYIAAEGKAKNYKGLKRGYPLMVLKEEFTLPEITFNQRIAFGILCALEVCDDVAFRNWAEKWLSGEDRAAETAQAAWAKALTTRTVVRAAWTAWSTLAAARATWAATQVEWTARADVREAAKAAAQAAEISANKPLDLIAPAEKAITYN